MVKQLAWIDIESTGLDPAKNDVVQIALLIEENGEIVEEAEIKLRPNPGSVISDAALRTTNSTIEQIQAYPSQAEGLYKFKKVLDGYVSRYDKRDKLFLAGYNIKFDVDFLNAAFEKNHDSYFFSYFFSCFIDVKSNVGEYFLQDDIVLPNYKLSTVCSHFGIKFKPHDAMEDIKATRKLYYEIKNAIIV